MKTKNQGRLDSNDCILPKSKYEFDRGFDTGFEFAQRWIPVEEELPEEDGQEILLKNEKWIHKDFNIKGVRAGSYGDGIWTSAYWCALHDEYHTRNSDEDDETFTDFKAENQIPTHWRKIDII